ncbi:FadR/GntR family transcriptional regulator [Actinoplanes aureus]|uniref:FadR/GntR family transcriptional regulator n=1 Tax=Actinoplanes aureus TaxID=2792083 RepID=UPI0028153D2A|nr:FCD domain-containing protein [Actinoplanes aureus]
MRRRTAAAAANPRRPSRTDEVQQQIKHLILERGLTAGDPMPTELELLEEINVSRNSLREALKALQAVGIVEIRHGFGMYVGTMSLVSLVDELTFHGRMSLQAGRNDLRHLVQIREVLESGLIQQVIRERGTGAAGDELTGVMEQMEAEARAGAVSAETDKRFHELLYQPLGNPLVIQLLAAFWDVYHALHAELDEADETPAEIAARHRRVYDAVRAGDVEESIAALNEHFSGIRRRLSRPEDG